MITAKQLAEVFAPSQLNVIATMLAMQEPEPAGDALQILQVLNAAHETLDGRPCEILAAEDVLEYSLV